MDEDVVVDADIGEPTHARLQAAGVIAAGDADETGARARVDTQLGVVVRACPAGLGTGELVGSGQDVPDAAATAVAPASPGRRVTLSAMRARLPVRPRK